MFCFSFARILSLVCIRMDLRVLVLLKVICCTLVCQKIFFEFLTKTRNIWKRCGDIFDF